MKFSGGAWAQRLGAKGRDGKVIAGRHPYYTIMVKNIPPATLGPVSWRQPRAKFFSHS